MLPRAGPVLGLASVATGFGWGYVFARLPGGWPLTVVLAMLGIGALVPLVNADVCCWGKCRRNRPPAPERTDAVGPNRTLTLCEP